MGKCVYCGNELSDNVFKAKAHTRYFDVCGNRCKRDMGTYLEKDKKWKQVMYLMIFAGGIGFLISALLGKGQYGMLGAYLGQIVGGAAFFLFPYPIASFETFESVSIKRVVLICRILGVFLMVWGLVLVIGLFLQV